MQMNPYAQQQQGYNPYLQNQQGASPAANMAPPKTRGELKQGGAIPIGEFVGTCTGFRVEPDNYGNRNIFVTFDGIQVLYTDSPWPQAQCEIRIRESESMSSGWGMFLESACVALGVSLEDPTFGINNLQGYNLHVVKCKDFLYGFNTQRNNERMAGDVWFVHAAVAPGTQVASVFPQYQGRMSQQAQQQIANQAGGAPQAGAPMGQMSPQQAPINQAPVQQQPAQSPTVSPEAQAAAQAQAAQQAANAQAAAAPAQELPTDPTERAKVLLTGRQRSQFLEVALPDTVLQGDPALYNSLANFAFIESVIASGEFTEGPDLVFVRNR